MTSSTKVRIALLAGALAFTALPAAAQSGPYGYPGPYSAGPNESVIVVAPRFRAQSSPLNGPMERVSYSGTVRYDDLDISTYHGARELRHRVYEEARNVCGRLREAYPVYTLNSSRSCFRDALDNGLVKADAAITSAREEYWDRYAY
jgi:UrcA family protein